MIRTIGRTRVLSRMGRIMGKQVDGTSQELRVRYMKSGVLFRRSLGSSYIPKFGIKGRV